MIVTKRCAGCGSQVPVQFLEGVSLQNMKATGGDSVSVNICPACRAEHSARLARAQQLYAGKLERNFGSMNGRFSRLSR
jgi:hypothetical protein